MGKFIGFSKIGQFSGVVKDVSKTANWNNEKPGKISFHGTVKSHGTNAGVVFAPDGSYHIQSRKNVITVMKDNAGFAAFAEKNIEAFKTFNETMRQENPYLEKETLAFFGEWAGKGVQKGVGIANLDKFFVMFGVKVKEVLDENKEVVKDACYLHQEVWENIKNEDSRIFNVNDFKSWDIEIDFMNPKEASNKMIALVEEVEKSCPIAEQIHKHDGKELPEDNVGEGIVWVGWDGDTRYVFKTKGAKHSASKVKVLVEVDIAKVTSVNEFVENHVTENRLNQGIEQCFTVEGITDYDRKDTGKFLKWMANDIVTEEMDSLVKSDLTAKDVNGPISKAARLWFFKHLDEKAGL